MKKKIELISSIIMSIIIISISVRVYANNSNIVTSLQQQELENDKVQIEVYISDIMNVGEGINAYSGVLNFNSEELTLVDIKGEGDWNTPTYNKNTGDKGMTKIVCTSNQFNTNKGALFIAVFDKKVQKQNYDVTFTEFEAAAKVDGKTIKVKENTQKEGSANLVQNSNNVTESHNTESTSNNKMYIAFGIIIIAIIVVFALKLRRDNENKEDK